MSISNAIDQIVMPFGAGDLMATGMQLLFFVGLFVLLSLAFKVVPMFIGAIKDSFEHNYRSEFSKEYNRIHLMKFGVPEKELRKMNRASFRYGVKMHYQRRKREWNEE